MHKGFGALILLGLRQPPFRKFPLDMPAEARHQHLHQFPCRRHIAAPVILAHEIHQRFFLRSRRIANLAHRAQCFDTLAARQTGEMPDLPRHRGFAGVRFAGIHAGAGQGARRIPRRGGGTVSSIHSVSVAFFAGVPPAIIFVAAQFQ